MGVKEGDIIREGVYLFTISGSKLSSVFNPELLCDLLPSVYTHLHKNICTPVCKNIVLLCTCKLLQRSLQPSFCSEL